MAAQKTRPHTPRCDISSMLTAKEDSAWLGLTQGEKHRLRVSTWPPATLGDLAVALMAAAWSARQVVPPEKRRQMERHTGFVSTTTPNSDLREGGARQITWSYSIIAYVLQTAFKFYGL